MNAYNTSLQMNDAFKGAKFVEDAAKVSKIGEALENPDTYAAAAQVGAMAGNAMNLGARNNGLIKKEGFKFDATATGASIGATVASIVPVVGTGVGAAVGAAVGFGVDVMRYHKSNQTYEKNMYVSTALQQQNKSSLDYTGLQV